MSTAFVEVNTELSEVAVANTHDEDWLKKRGVTDKAVLKALKEVPRAEFVVKGHDLPPLDIVGRMLTAMKIQPDSNLLQVGTGTGYEAALLSRLAVSVYSVERDDRVAKNAARKLNDLNFKNVQVLYGSTLKQYAANAPYDGILVSAAMAKLPQRLAKRLGIGGSLVAPIGLGSTQELVRLRRLDEKRFKEDKLGDLTVKKLLGDILVEMGVIDRQDIERAAMDADENGKMLGEALLEGEYVREADIYRALGKQRGWKLLSAEEVLRTMERELIGEIPRAFLIHNRILPVHKRDGTLHMVTTDAGVDSKELAAALGMQFIELALITPSDFQVVWAAVNSAGKPPAPVTRELGGSSSVMLDQAGSIDANTIGFFEKCLLAAIDQRASDVHFERHEEKVTIRFRVDGDLRTYDRPLNAEGLLGIVQLVKVSARMDQTENRLPQAGNFQRRIGGNVYDVRARTQPGVFGETVVLRILPQDKGILTVDELGFTPTVATQIKQRLARRAGIFLVVGPAGSGRSSTAYAALREITKDSTRKIISVEYPRTYSLEGVNQLKVDSSREFSVSTAIEWAMGDDADALLVGDINDPEIARWAIRASQAGHLVIGTVFGRDTVDGIRALFELGVDPNVVASELGGVVAQRLVKQVCTDCSEHDEIEPALFEDVLGNVPEGQEAFAGAGCSVCEDRGTNGRIAVTEYLRITPEIREAISSKATIGQLRSAAQDSGIQTMLDRAIDLVSDGVIPQQELRWIPTWKR